MVEENPEGKPSDTGCERHPMHGMESNPGCCSQDSNPGHSDECQASHKKDITLSFLTHEKGNLKKFKEIIFFMYSLLIDVDKSRRIQDFSDGFPNFVLK